MSIALFDPYSGFKQLAMDKAHNDYLYFLVFLLTNGVVELRPCHYLTHGQGFAYRTGPPNCRPPVSVNRSVSRDYRSKPNKFKIQIETTVQSVSISKPLGKDR
jgi:hypothetical protein